MTINKILPNYTDWNQRIFGEKINELVDAVNSLTGGEKEKCSDPRGNELCTDGINTYHQFNTTEPGYKCSYCNQKAPKKPEPKSNTLRETLAKIMREYPSSDLNSLETADQILSLVKVHLEKEVAKASTPGEYVYTENIKQIIRNL